MPSPEPHPAPEERGPAELQSAWEPLAAMDLGSDNTDLIRLVAAAADLCRKPLRHGVVVVGKPPIDALATGAGVEPLEVNLRLEVRTTQGERCPAEDLELEIYPSGTDLNLTLAWIADESRPMLWQGQHPVWMDAAGSRCAPPADGAPLEALARRLRALLAGATNS